MKVFVPNLKERIDRKDHIISEFCYFNKFDLNIIDAVKHKYGSVGLWLTLSKLLIMSKMKI